MPEKRNRMDQFERNYIHPEPEVIENRRFRILRLLNYSLIASLLTYAGIYALIDFSLLLPLIVVLFFTILSLIFSIYYNNRGKYTVAGNVLIYSISVSLFITCAMLGGTPDFHNFFLLYSIIGFLTVPLKLRAYLFCMVITNLAFFAFIEFFYHPEQPYIEFPSRYIAHFENSFFVLIFLTIAIVLFYYKFITEKFEFVVNGQKNKLSSLNLELEKQAKDLKDLYAELKERQQQVEDQSEELKQQKENLQQANNQLNKLIATKDKFFSIIAHDLKNPIGLIIGFSTLLENNILKKENTRIYKYAKNISESAQKTFHLLENLLLWAQSQNSQLRCNPQSVLINELINTNIQLFREHASEKKLTLKNEYDNLEYFTYCDRNMIDTVIRNLLSNAIKFTPTGGTVFIRLKNTKIHNANYINICIADSGIGISNERIKTLFQIDKSISTKGTTGEKGSGLGLILCKEFVELNKGELHVHSEPERGTEFTLMLPAVNN